jgi:hypothetical protein
MRKALFTFLLFFTLQAHAAWDSSVLIGHWDNYKYDGFSQQYQKLIINKDFSGSYFRISGNSKGETFKFKKSDFKFFDGFAVLDISDNLKLLLSAWGTRQTGFTKRLLGQMFVYRKVGSEIKLINSIPISYSSATDGGFDAFYNRVKNAQTKSH